MKQKKSLLQQLSDGKKKFAPLVDPDKYSVQGITKTSKLCEKAGVSFLLYGGSLLVTGNHAKYIRILKDNCSAKVVLFPGNNLQISDKADAILLLSLISGRNSEMLIGRHVVAAPVLKASGLEILPTGYMLIDSTKPTAVSYMSNSTPIPGDKYDIAACTAMAGEMLGLQLIYLDAGSGAGQPVSPEMIRIVKESIHSPLVAGGGIRTIQQAEKTLSAGADLIVVGNAIEQNPELILRLAESIG